MNKIKTSTIIKVLIAVAVSTAFFMCIYSKLVHAGGYTCTCTHRCTKGCTDPDCELCKLDYKLCEAEEESEDEKDPVITKPDTAKAEEVHEADKPLVAPVEHYGPLTPSGNMTLVDDYGSVKSGKQFITVQTKAGNYFYIIIDRDDKGDETVHFLNKVDEADLLSLMDDEEVEQYIAVRGGGEDKKKAVKEEPKEEPEEKEEKEVKEEPEKKKGTGILGLILVAGIAAAGGYIYVTKFKAKKPQDNTEDPDADYNEEEEEYVYPEITEEETYPGNNEGSDETDTGDEEKED